MKIRAFACLAMFIATFACSSHNENAPMQDANLPSNETTIQTIDKNKQITSSHCVIQTMEGVEPLSTPAKLLLPINQEAPLADIIVTCSQDDQTRTAILKSRMANSQSNVVVDSTTGNSFLATQLNTGQATSGLDNVSNALVLGLSTNVIAGNFYVYPSLVTIEF